MTSTSDEDSSSTTDSQSSTSSLLNAVADATCDVPANKEPVNERVAEIENGLLHSSANFESWGGQDRKFDNNMKSHYINANTVNEPYSASGTSGCLIGQAATSPADSGHHSLSSRHSSVGVGRSSESEVTFPQREQYPGEYDFHVFFASDLQNVCVSKSAPYTYSKDLRKLFVQINTPCPIKFALSHRPRVESKIRTLIVFSADEHVHNTVKRCVVHKRGDDYPGILQVVNHARGSINSQYKLYCANHHSIITSYIHPDDHHEPFTIQYKFGCRSSCVGGINRRFTYMMFQLEDCFGTVLGRDLIQLKICCSPGRDLKKEMNKIRHGEMEASAATLSEPAITRRKLSGLGYRCLYVRKENYAFLSSINDGLNFIADRSTKSASEKEDV